jgi:signal transduction histidine kinase
MLVQGELLSTGVGGGLGIGLALAQRLVEMHGGSIVARSAGPGLGSSFTVSLPVEPAAIALVLAEGATDGSGRDRAAPAALV